MKGIAREVLTIKAIADNLDMIADTIEGKQSLMIWGLSQCLNDIAERLESYE